MGNLMNQSKGSVYCLIDNYMLRKICLFFTFILLLSCNAKKEVAPPPNYSKILNHSKMVDVLVDVCLIEAALQNNMQDGKDLKQYTTHCYNYLYKKHQINRQQFLNSMEYYCFRTKELSQIYNNVINHLAVMQIPVVK